MGVERVRLALVGQGGIGIQQPEFDSLQDIVVRAQEMDQRRSQLQQSKQRTEQETEHAPYHTHSSRAAMTVPCRSANTHRQQIGMMI